MLSMTDSLPPKFPMMTPPLMTPEDMQKASEKAINFWVGALSPMWVPFWAASSFGLGAWAMTRNMKRWEPPSWTPPPMFSPKRK